jgi:hypothetical protein
MCVDSIARPATRSRGSLAAKRGAARLPPEGLLRAILNNVLVFEFVQKKVEVFNGPRH